MKKKVNAENVTLIVYIILVLALVVYLAIHDIAGNITWIAGILLLLPAFGLICLWAQLLPNKSRLLPVLSIISIIGLLALASLLCVSVRANNNAVPMAYTGLSPFMVHLRTAVEMFAYGFATVFLGGMLTELFGKGYHNYKGHIK